MSRINTNINSLIAQRILGQKQTELTKSLERLSTGLAINRGSDNPAGLIASEKLRSEKAAIGAAIGNAERADQVVNIAEGGLTEVQSLLTEMQSLVGATANDAGLSAEEKDANQLQIDQILSTIDRIASTTSFGGVKLLNGGFDFVVSGVDTDVSDYKVNGAKIAEGTNVDVNLIVTQSAQHGGYFVNMQATTMNTGADDAASKLTFEIAGAKGVRQFSFASGTAVTDMAAAINQFVSVTGVSAVVSGAGGDAVSALVLKSTDYGSNGFVSVRFKSLEAAQVGQIDGLDATNEALAAGAAAAFTDSAAYADYGQDVGVIANGISARGRGLEASVSSDSLDLSVTLTAAGATTLGSLTALTITGGGAKFNLGPSVDLSNQVRLGIQNVSTRNLGNADLGFLDELGSGKASNLVNGDMEAGQQIVNKAADQVSSMRGRLGAFQKYVVGSTINALNVALENTSAAEAAIRDTDFAEETANMTRNQILVQAATNVLSIANSMPQNVLNLLR